MVVASSSTAHADTFTGAGDGTSWEDGANWAAGVVPLNNASGNTFIGANDQVVFDAASLAAVQAAGNAQGNGQYRILRLLIGDQTSGATNGTHSITFDHGGGSIGTPGVLVTNANSAVIGGRPDKFSTVNVVSVVTNIEANRIRVGQGVGGSGTINVSGGDLILGRGGLELGSTNNTGAVDQGLLSITGGTFQTRNDAEIFAAGTFEVIGTDATLIGIGSAGNTDGRWVQDGILRPGLDATGVTTILIDDVGDDGTGGTATFNAGSILDPFDNGGFFTNVYEDVLFAEGGITGAPTLSSAAVAAGFESRIINGDTLQVRLVSAIPEPSSLALLGFGGLALIGRRRK